MRIASTGTEPRTPTTRRRDPDRTRAELLEVAAQEFSDAGFSGARVDRIATRTSTTKRMIYYYFESKAGLYRAVLERAYAGIRDLEQSLDVDGLDPVDALRRLAEITFDYHEAHPEFARLVSIENIHRAEHLSQLPDLSRLARPAIDVVERILDRGRAEHVFRDGIEAVDVHMIISGYCIFRGANRHTFDAVFGRDLLARRHRAHLRRLAADLVVGVVCV